jgi:hypothetical protein
MAFGDNFLQNFRGRITTDKYESWLDCAMYIDVIG